MVENIRRAGIVGGGIGGLAAAIALRRTGWDVAVYEQASEFTEVGAGIALAANGLAALDQLGVGETLRAHVMADRSAGIRSRRGRTLITGRLGDIAGDGLAIVHRAELIATLVDALPVSCLRPNSRVHAVDESGTIETDTGTTQFDLVVAADGVHSVARSQLWPDHGEVYNTGVTAWRWVVEAPAPDFIGMVWGDRGDMGIFPMSGNRTYVWAAGRPGIDDLTHFAGWTDPVPALIAAADPARVVEDDLQYIRVPRQLARGRVALLGDAAHAMPPTLGQGAAMALEDAVTLAVHAPDLAGYSRARRRRVRALSTLSRLGLYVLDPQIRPIAALRDMAAMATPNRVEVWSARTFTNRAIANWQAPRLGEAAATH